MIRTIPLEMGTISNGMDLMEKIVNLSKRRAAHCIILKLAMGEPRLFVRINV